MPFRALSSFRFVFAAISLVMMCFHTAAFAGRCATERHRGVRRDFRPLAPAERDGSVGAGAALGIAGAATLVTEHFRILWGAGFDWADDHGPDPDGDGVPTWISTLADALEDAHRQQVELGFPEPYGGERVFLDVYVANTGLEIAGEPVVLPSRYLAYTEVDAHHEAVYFVFGDRLSTHTVDEHSALRATAAHELFHGVQRVDYPWDDEVLVPEPRWRREGWWMEATATWMEEVCVPEADQYLSDVMHFLAHPEEPLTRLNGSHEYGASIFPGYLWLQHGGPEVWQETFKSAWDVGLEGSLGAVLAARGSSLSREVSAFWVAAAHPEDFWPDGQAFYTPFAPAIHYAAEQLPAELSASVYSAPGRFGANLIRLSGLPGKVTVEILGADEAEAWALAASSRGLSASEGLPSEGRGLTLQSLEGEDQYLAVVNLGEGRRVFRAVLSPAVEPTGGGPTAPKTKVGESGGCFLDSLLP